MTREEAFEGLQSGSAHLRLQAARYFTKNITLGDGAIIGAARRRETVSYVKASLDLALSRLAQLSAQDDPPKVTSNAILQRARREATEWIAGLILHEIASPIGRVALAASREVANYESSTTKLRLDRLRQIFEAIESLKGAAAVPRPQEFDLAELVSRIVSEEAAPYREEISIQGQGPFVLTSDPSMLGLGITNGLRNALEAVHGGGALAPHPIVLTWGETDIDYWLAITDSGPGITGLPETAFQIGASNKDGHSGFGLAIAKQALESVGGRILLSSPKGGGMVYELRWDR